MDEIIAAIKTFAGNFAPQDYMFCNGAILQINQYQALYSLLGNSFGGDGHTNFALPDLRPDIVEYTIEGETPNQKIVQKITGKRNWKADEPKQIICVNGIYPMHP